MTIVFNDDDLLASYRQQRTILRVFLAVTVLYAVICVALLLFYMSLPYKDPAQIWPKVIVCTLSCIYVIFAYVFMGIKFHRARRYYKLISYFSVGMKQVNNSIFLRYAQPELRDGVDFYVDFVRQLLQDTQGHLLVESEVPISAWTKEKDATGTDWTVVT